MLSVTQALLTGERPVTRREWDVFWDRLEARRLDRQDVAQVLAALSMQAPRRASVDSLVEALDARRPHLPRERAVNIVGTGGGPPTFNISTAAALVAAATGVPVIKSGSRGYSGRRGSIDMLELLGVPVVTSYEEMQDALERFGVAFVGRFVYPPQLTLLAKAVLPLDIREFDGFFKRIAPLLAAVPVCAQVTGVANVEDLPLLRHLARRRARHPVWFCHNDLGIDELVSFRTNVIHRERDEGDLVLTPAALGLAGGSLAELAAAPDTGRSMRQFHALLDGHGSPAAIETICLNAAALALACGVCRDWARAMRACRRAMELGEPRAILRRMRELRRAFA